MTPRTRTAHRPKLPEPFTREWLKNGFNSLTASEARELISRTQSGNFDADSIRSHVKSLIGMSWDGKFDEVRSGLWKVADMLTIIRLVKPKRERGA